MEHHTVSLLLTHVDSVESVLQKVNKFYKFNFSTLFSIVVDGSANHLTTENQIVFLQCLEVCCRVPFNGRDL